MAANIDELCDAIRDQINGETWSPAVTAEVDDTPIFTVSELDDLHLTIIPFSIAWEDHTRADDKLIHTIELHFQQKGLPPPSPPAVDPMAAMARNLRKLQSTIVHWLRKIENRRPPTYTEAILIDAHSKAPMQPVKSATEHRPLYDMQLLAKERMFWGVVRLNYVEHVRHDATI
jgi:hypothetical protein